VLQYYRKCIHIRDTVYRSTKEGCLTLALSWKASQKNAIFKVVCKGRRGRRKQGETVSIRFREKRTLSILGTEEV